MIRKQILLCLKLLETCGGFFVLFGVSSSNELGLGLVIPGIVSAAIYFSSSFLKFTYFNIRFEPARVFVSSSAGAE